MRPTRENRKRQFVAVARGGSEAVIEVDIIQKAMHQDNSRLFARVVSCINPVLIPLYKFLLEFHGFTAYCRALKILRFQELMFD
jgi:hypothetical protein